MERKYTAVILRLFLRRQNKKPLTSTGHSVMICEESKQKMLDRGCVFYESLPGCDRHRRKEVKGKDAERVHGLGMHCLGMK